MRGFILAAGLGLAAAPAWAQTANNPTFTREQQGGSVVTGQVSCGSTSTTVYAGNGDARAIRISAVDTNGARNAGPVCKRDRCRVPGRSGSVHFV
jgi:hypothetical protein